VRTRLEWAGFGSLGAGLWISPHPEREAEAVRVLREAKVEREAHVFTARRSDVGDVRSMVAQAWDLEAIEAAYEEFSATFRDEVPRDVLTRQLELVHAWRRFPGVDPALPRELLPAKWSGATAAVLFADRHARWADDARREWRRLNSAR
jgi:phenylacetic acid degradation operon negative regulatory protein